MFSILGRKVRLCDGITRREVMRIGGLGFTGLMCSDWLRAQAAAELSTRAGAPAAGSFGKAKACILIYSYGGPSHLDTLDLKPEAPLEIRGEFQPIATRVPGTSICEHLPRLAALADRYAIIRSAGHRDNDHAIGAYLVLTGYSHPKNSVLGIEPPASPQDLPSVGSVVSKLRAAQEAMFSYVTLGDLRHLGNHDSMGQNAGCLGKAYDPFTVPFKRPGNGELDMSLVASVLGEADGARLGRRRQFLDVISRAAPALDATHNVRAIDNFSRKAFELLSSKASRDAFDLLQEPQPIRDAYGADPFGKNCLLARRLVEAGVPLVTLYSGGNRDWDTHNDNFRNLKNTLLPPTDRGVSVLLEDLESRGLLDQTLVVWMGEMGRTPLINKGAGRDHWSFCFSLLMAGGGIRGGQVYGTSDRGASYPAQNPVSPANIAATIFHCLGIDSHGHVQDQAGRPLIISAGEPISAILA
ncbi:MAG TPA: DUF1501 domain-containing protein [Planctomycetaceae bacterium]|nr:DUF1501 domain-containing protein [Planctomycetaceae bacterium]